MKENWLSFNERQALLKFVTYLNRSLVPIPGTVALFGSKARGDSQPESDVDVLVILPKENRPLRRDVLREAARISLQYDVLISPRVIGRDRWEQMRGFSLYRNVLRESAGLCVVGDELTFIPIQDMEDGQR